jgi:hypothetical protein
MNARGVAILGAFATFCVSAGMCAGILVADRLDDLERRRG